MRRLLVWLMLVVVFSQARAQRGMSPVNKIHHQLLIDHLAKAGGIQQTACAPFLVPALQLDSIFDADTKAWQRREHETWFMRKMRNEHLVEIHEDDLYFVADIGLNLEAARQLDADGRRRYTNTRGFQLSGSIGERIFFASSFYENQSIFPAYMDSVVYARGSFNNPADPERGSVPGFGRWKPFNTSDSYDYDYSLVTGYVGVALGDQSFLQFGHDKQFVGYGYRSMFLSDASAPYPFLRAHFSAWQGRITYSTTYAVLQSLERIAPNYNNKEAMFRRLGARFSYLHFEPVKWAGIGIFDGTTWTWRDNNHPESIEYYMPYGGVYTGNGLRNHLIGLNGHLKPFPFLEGYFQYGTNTQTRGNVAQLGARFSGLVSGLTLVAEWNHTGEGAYFSDQAGGTMLVAEPFQQGTEVLDYYQHSDQSLGHPTLIASNESLFRIQYRNRDFFFNGSYHHTRFAAVFGNRTQDFIQLELGYFVNPRSNAQIVIGHIDRTEKKPTMGLQENYTYLAIRTTMFNRYLAY